MYLDTSALTLNMGNSMRNIFDIDILKGQVKGGE